MYMHGHFNNNNNNKNNNNNNNKNNNNNNNNKNNNNNNNNNLFQKRNQRNQLICVLAPNGVSPQMSSNLQLLSDVPATRPKAFDLAKRFADCRSKDISAQK